MQVDKQRSRRGFTEAARAAAVAARRAKAANPKGSSVEVFAVRPDEEGVGFAWEIRRFGGIVLAHSDSIYATPSEAICAGRRYFAEAVGH